jgi:hypothetical protein
LLQANSIGGSETQSLKNEINMAQHTAKEHQTNMSLPTGAQHHYKAAEHHEKAARHHREAAKYYEQGDHEKAAHHAHIAYGHHLHAVHHIEAAAKIYEEEHRARSHADS